MSKLREELFSTIEGKDINVYITTENSKMSCILRHIYIDSDETILSNNDELTIDWDKAEISNNGNLYTIKLPEVTYEIKEVDDGYC